MKDLLRVEHLTGGYASSKPVLNNVNFSIGKGELVALIGLNGAGKSTTIKHIIGLLEPKKGAVKLNGKTLEDDPEAYKKSFTYIPEMPILYDELTLWEHLELTAMAYGIERKTFEERANHLLKEYRMEKSKNWYPGRFSKGMRQKVMIMCAFLVEPSLYIVDEPFMGLDPIGINSLLEEMMKAREKGASILMSTHILSTAEQYCDRFIIIHNGKIIADGTLEVLQKKFKKEQATLDEIYIELTKER
ncbi:ABC transporter ATP-binding protein [Massilibacterium senegalense]|uniref:ABC transporter ATP-binding protein n=1 Tax=Massilibacterium senegalense TaxID=1632858 RepID=UPI0007851233|nr:ABC transporter ATP-binding protein [Massilibacterium senegalense]